MSLQLDEYEQKFILSCPDALALLMDHHDLQQDMADSMGAETHGDELRREELRQHGANLIAIDPNIWSDEIRAKFAEPTGYTAQRLARARAHASGVQALDPARPWRAHQHSPGHWSVARDPLPGQGIIEYLRGPGNLNAREAKAIAEAANAGVRMTDGGQHG